MSKTDFKNTKATSKFSRIHDLAKVFSISPSSPFLDELVSALCDGRIFKNFRPSENPQLLPEATIFVPSRRAARALSIAFLDASDGEAQLLPSIKTLGDVGDDEFGIVSGIDDIASIPNSVGALERKLILSTLVRKWVDALSAETRRLYGDEEIFIPSSQADAVRLSADLCKLLDEITQEESGWAKIESVVPQEHAQWWSLTSNFLGIIMENWPKVLAARGLMDPAMRSLALLEKRIERYATNGSKGPVIVAGSTGSVPSTRKFLEVISKLPNGAIVLPGVDKAISGAEWQSLDPKHQSAGASPESHPQFGLATLLRALGVERDNVVDLDQTANEIGDRSKIVSTALSMPEYSGQWRENVSSFTEENLLLAFEPVTLIEAGNERQEALAIALALRETLETKNKSAALVTPDRNLAHRVSIELHRFGIEVDDTAGAPLRNTQFGLFVRQLLQFCFGHAARADIAALLKSPMMPAGSSHDDARQVGEIYERYFLRGTIGLPQAGSLSDWVKGQSGRTSTTRSSNLPEDVLAQVLAQSRNIDAALLEMKALTHSTEVQPLHRYIEKLISAFERLCIDDNGIQLCQASVGYIEMQALFEEILATAASGFLIEPADFPSVFEAIIAPITVRLRTPTHPRLHIYGPLEVRLLNHDRIILGGLNEGTWPGATRNDAFLNRLMRHQLGMASPERGTGLAAHDFQQLIGKKEIFLSRSSRVDKAPTISSRWVQRLLAVVGEPTSGAMRRRGNRLLAFANMMDDTGQKPKRGKRPCPAPPVEARPTSLPVTDIETWIRDPYALYAKRILGLRALMPLEREPDNLLKGTLYHAIMEDYVNHSRFEQEEATRLSDLKELARLHIVAEKLPADIEALWLMRFEEIAEKFVQWETLYQAEYCAREIHKEIQGGIPLANKGFYLHARADRIDILSDGRILVMDYKTGNSPSVAQARTLSPQLALEGAIARKGGFNDIAEGELADLAFMRLRQGSDFKFEQVADNNNSIDEIVETAVSNLEALINKFKDPAMGYISRRAPFKHEMMDLDYDHLARTREWSFGEEGDNE